MITKWFGETFTQQAELNKELLLSCKFESTKYDLKNVAEKAVILLLY